MHALTSTQGIVALAAGAVAVVALMCAMALALSLRRLRRQQKAVLGSDEHDLVGHAVELQDAFAQLRDYVEDVAQRLDARLGQAEAALHGAISHRALVRYDAYNEMSGHQSMSIALLDASQSGIVLSSIHHRDQARLYAKHMREGRPELELSPEEAEAVRLALSAEGQIPQSPPADR